jgi:hypothetical protein
MTQIFLIALLVLVAPFRLGIIYQMLLDESDCQGVGQDDLLAPTLNVIERTDLVAL